MKLDEFKEFISSFGIKEDTIEGYVGSKKLFESSKGIFLREKPLDQNIQFDDSCIYIKLQKTLPTTYLLRLIQELGGKCIELQSAKEELNFTYGKVIPYNKKSPSKHILITFKTKLLGYATIEYGKIKPLMDVGEYLRE